MTLAVSWDRPKPARSLAYPLGRLDTLAVPDVCESRCNLRLRVTKEPGHDWQLNSLHGGLRGKCMETILNPE